MNWTKFVRVDTTCWQESTNWWSRVIKFEGRLSKVVFIFWENVGTHSSKESSMSKCACVHVCVRASLLQGCLAEPETQLLALIDFSDRERFSSPETHTFKSAQKLAGRRGSPISMVKWHLSTPSADVLAGRRGSGARGRGWQRQHGRLLR